MLYKEIIYSSFKKIKRRILKIINIVDYCIRFLSLSSAIRLHRFSFIKSGVCENL